jgi:cobaltochelatase CobT
MGIFDGFFSEKTQKPLSPLEQVAEPQAYTVFTKEFDEIITGDDIRAILKPSGDVFNVRFDVATQDFSRRFQQERLEIYESSTPLVRRFLARFSQAEREKMVVSFLIDHSGSTRGLKMLSALVAVECAISILDQCSIRTEVLGFTTTSWHGGKSRRKWKRAGSPANPGRLCDLRHIVYKTWEQDRRWEPNLIFALHPDISRENIDGEALEWAASRLDKSVWDKRAVCFLSDGAPVDDSSLLENFDQRFLVNHLIDVEKSAEQDGIEVGYLLLSGDANYRPCRLSQVGLEPEMAGKGLLCLIERMLMPETEETVTDS